MEKTDQQLWEEFRKGNEQSFAHLYKRFYSDLFLYAVKLTQERETAEDAIHDTFVYMWQNRLRLGEVASLKFYLLRSVRNQALRSLRKKKNLEFMDQAAQEGAFRIQPQELKLKDPSAATKAKVEAALLELSPRQREVIHLKYFENLEYQEIAELLGVNYQSAVNLAHRAIIKLRKAEILKYFDNF